MQQSDFVTRGQSLVNAGQFQEAVKVCRLGLLGRPTTVEGRIVLGQALLALKRYDEVLAEMRVALELDHSSTVAATLKGEALLRKGDFHGALETLSPLRGDPHVAKLVDEAQRASGRPPVSASHPSVGFVGQDTKHYPSAEEADGRPTNRKITNGGNGKPAPAPARQQLWEDDGEETGDVGHYTRPTSLAAPTAKKKTSNVPVVQAPSDATPPPNVLAVGDRSGTVEVDPDIDGVELDNRDDDFGALAAPPASSGKRRAPDFAEERGSVKRAAPPPSGSRGKQPQQAQQQQARKPPPKKNQKENSTVELDDDELVEMKETLLPPSAAKKPGSTKVRSSVNIAAGPLPDSPIPSVASSRRTQPAQDAVGPQQLANLLAQQPNIQMQPPSIRAALPTAAAMPMPPAPYGNQPVVDSLFGQQQQQQPGVAPAWAKSTVAAQPSYPPGPMGPGIAGMLPPYPPGAGPQLSIDPAVQALLDGVDPASIGLPPVEPTNSSASRPMKTGIRKGRSRFAIMMWIFVGALVIGGGVFAGFWIRAKKLEDKIAKVRGAAYYAARIDTWRAWLDARDDLGGIAKASSTIPNRASLARVRALIAFEYGDGAPESRIALDNLAKDDGGIDETIGTAYLALAQHEPKLAKSAIESLKKDAESSGLAVTKYLEAQLLLQEGDGKKAIALFDEAIKKDTDEAKADQKQVNDEKVAQRPPIVHANYYLGLARAKQAIADWRGALAAIDAAQAVSPDNPGVILERAFTLAAANATPASIAESKKPLEGLVDEAGKKVSEQKRGVSPLQVSLANLALAEVAQSAGDSQTAHTHVSIAANVGVDDERFADAACETLLYIADPALAATATEQTLARFPTSQRAQIVNAQLLVAIGRAGEADDFLSSKGSAAANSPRGRAVLGLAHLANDDYESALSELTKAADATSNRLDLAVAGLALVELAQGKAELGKKRIGAFLDSVAKDNPAAGKTGVELDGNTVTIGLAHAAIVRRLGQREEALAILQKLEKAPGPDGTRIHIELARAYRDLGNMKDAKAQLAAPVEANNGEARFEMAIVLFENGEVAAARAAFDKLVTEAGAKAPAPLVVETARIRMLVGDHGGAQNLLDQIPPGASGTIGWKTERERARLFFRKGDNVEAAKRIATALDGCGDDIDTFYLATDIMFVDIQTDEVQGALGKKLDGLVTSRLSNRVEAKVIAAKLAIANGRLDEAQKLYVAAADMYKKAPAPKRRVTQVDFGMGVIALFASNKNAAAAAQTFELVTTSDPTNYDAYLFLADALREAGDLKRALEAAKLAVELDKDLVQGWALYGELAAAARNGKALGDAITRVGEIAPNSPELAALQALRK